MDSLSSSREKSGDLRDLRDDLHLDESPWYSSELYGLFEAEAVPEAIGELIFSIELYRLEAKCVKSMGTDGLCVGDVWRLKDIPW